MHRPPRFHGFISEVEEYQQICWMAKLALTVPVINAWLERGGDAIKRMKTLK